MSEKHRIIIDTDTGGDDAAAIILAAKSRLISSSKINNQQHARKYTSVFYCFKKTIKKKSKNFNYFELIDVLSVNEKNR